MSRRLWTPPERSLTIPSGGAGGCGVFDDPDMIHNGRSGAVLPPLWIADWKYSGKETPTSWRTLTYRSEMFYKPIIADNYVVTLNSINNLYRLGRNASLSSPTKVYDGASSVYAGYPRVLSSGRIVVPMKTNGVGSFFFVVSDDGGYSWAVKTVASGSIEDAYTLHFIELSDRLVCVCTLHNAGTGKDDAYAYVSFDDGDSFTPYLIVADLGAYVPPKMLILRADNSLLVICNDEKTHVSNDGGVTWASSADASLAWLLGYYTDYSARMSSGRLLWFSPTYDKLQTSDDNGYTWTDRSSGGWPHTSKDLVILGNYLYRLNDTTDKIERSINEGTTWADWSPLLPSLTLPRIGAYGARFQ